MGRYAINILIGLLSVIGLQAQIPNLPPLATNAGQLFIQKATYGSSAAALTHTITLAKTPVQGDLMILCADADNTVSTPSGWTMQISSIHSGALYLFSKVAGASEPTSISVTLSGSTSCALGYVEFAGRSGTVDKTLATNGVSTTTLTCGPTATTTQASEVVIAAIGLWEGTGHTWGPFISFDHSFNMIIDISSTVTSAREDLGIAIALVTATGAYQSQGTWTTTATNTIDGVIATFK